MTTTTQSKLSKGFRYDVESLECVGWDGPDAGEGLHYSHYFDDDGTYKGPDADGNEPLFSGQPVDLCYTLTIRDGQCSEDVEFVHRPTSRQITAACQEWVDDGEWGDDGAAVDVWWTLTDPDGDEIDRGGETIDVEPNHAALINAAAREAGRRDDHCGDEPDDHDWTSEGEGGCDSNPGVWSTGGTSMRFASHCRCCGLHRVEESCGSQRNPGDHDVTTYRFFDADEIAQARESGSMDEADDD